MVEMQIVKEAITVTNSKLLIVKLRLNYPV